MVLFCNQRKAACTFNFSGSAALHKSAPPLMNIHSEKKEETCRRKELDCGISALFSCFDLPYSTIRVDGNQQPQGI